MTMRIFVGWSGESSRFFAGNFADWLRQLLPSVQVFVSDDISKGTRWRRELEAALRDAEFGVFCLTPDNIGSAWMHFEAGAISSLLKSDACVCPLLIGVGESDLSDPFKQFQAAKADRRSMRKLVLDVNARLPKQKRTTNIDAMFSKHWIELRKSISEVETSVRRDVHTPARKLQNIQRRLDKLELPTGLFRDCIQYGFGRFSDWAMSINDSMFQFEEPLQMREAGIVILKNLQRNGFMLMYFPDFDAWRSDSDPATEDDYLKACREINNGRKRKILLTRVYVLGNRKDLGNRHFHELHNTDRSAGIDTYSILYSEHPHDISPDWAIWDDELVCISDLQPTNEKKSIMGCRYYRDDAHVRRAQEWRNKILNLAEPLAK